MEKGKERCGYIDICIGGIRLTENWLGQLTRPDTTSPSWSLDIDYKLTSPSPHLDVQKDKRLSTKSDVMAVLGIHII